MQRGEIDAGLKLGTELFEKHADTPDELNNLAWDVIDPAVEKPDPRVVKLALQAARRAVELTKDAEPNYLDTLAEALFRSGDASAAVATEERVLELLKAKGNESADDLKEFNELPGAGSAKGRVQPPADNESRWRRLSGR